MLETSFASLIEASLVCPRICRKLEWVSSRPPANASFLLQVMTSLIGSICNILELWVEPMYPAQMLVNLTRKESTGFVPTVGLICTVMWSAGCFYQIRHASGSCCMLFKRKYVMSRPVLFRFSYVHLVSGIMFMYHAANLVLSRS